MARYLAQWVWLMSDHVCRNNNLDLQSPGWEVNSQCAIDIHNALRDK